MEDPRQLSLFGEPEPKPAPEKPQIGQGHSPSPSQSATPYKDHDQRLAELNLKYGATYVYRRGARLYAWGDFTHCPTADIEHNIRVLAQMLLAETGLTYIGKSYQADIYRHEGKVDWECMISEVKNLYRESLLEVDRDSNVLSVVEQKRG